MTPAPHQIIGVMILALCAVAVIVTIDYGYRLRWLSRARTWLRGRLDWLAGEPPQERTLEEYNNQYAHEQDYRDDGLTVAEAIAAVPELDLDGTQPFAAVFHDDAPDVAVPTVVLGDGSYAGLSGTIPTDVPRPGQPVGKGENWCDSSAAAGNRELAPLAAVPGYLPFQPHAGPPAWRPRHAKTTWVDELITEALGAPTVEHYMWNWQQRHRLAITA